MVTAAATVEACLRPLTYCFSILPKQKKFALSLTITIFSEAALLLKVTPHVITVKLSTFPVVCVKDFYFFLSAPQTQNGPTENDENDAKITISSSHIAVT